MYFWDNCAMKILRPVIYFLILIFMGVKSSYMRYIDRRIMHLIFLGGFLYYEVLASTFVFKDAKRSYMRYRDRNITDFYKLPRSLI